LLKPLEAPKWKSNNITMDFVIGLPHSPRVLFALSLIGLPKAHFIPIKMTNSAIDLVPLYVKETVRLHGVPKSIVSSWDSCLCLIFGEVYIVLWA
jgi:hypothetical protein